MEKYNKIKNRPTFLSSEQVQKWYSAFLRPKQIPYHEKITFAIN